MVFRFSSLGDVAMTVPVLKCLLLQYPQLQVTMVSTAFVKPLFDDIDRLQFYAADLKGKHKGVAGLFKLYRELQSLQQFNGIADLHNVLRTKIIRGFFTFSNIKKAAIDKGRKEKRELTRPVNKKLRPLKSTFQRYADVFSAIGFPVELEIEKGLRERSPHPEANNLKKEGFRLVGLAPFALHEEKMYPEDKMKEVMRLLTHIDGIRLFLLGGKNDAAKLEQWQTEFPRTSSLAGKMDFRSELDFISGLDVMVTMDSANMHLASLFGVPVVSIWGGTHPYLGFYGWGQDPENAVQVDLDCRPSSVFGNKPCPRGDMACMHMISPIIIYDKVIQQIYPS